MQQSHQRKSIPFTVVHPMVSSDRSPSPADPNLVTRSLDLATTASSPDDVQPSQSFDFSRSATPPWRAQDSSPSHQPSFLSAGSGSPRKSGGLVQSLRQAMQNRPSFSTFRSSKSDDKSKKSSSAATTGKANGAATEKNDVGKNATLATIRSVAKSSPAKASVVPSPKVNLPTITENINSNNCRPDHARKTPLVDCSSLVCELLNRTYSGDAAFIDATDDVDRLILLLQQQIDLCRTPCSASDLDLRKAKDGLVSESRQFVTDSKLLVSSATQSMDKLVINLNQSVHTLAKITQQCTNTMICIAAIPQAVTLGSRVKDVAIAYKTTVTAAQQAAGKPLSDPNMKMLMRQATSLAAILSALMKTLKMLDVS